MALSDYEKKEWDLLQKRKAATVRRRAREFLPDSLRDRASDAADLIRRAPGADFVADAYETAAEGLGNFIGSAASSTVRSESVVEQFRDAGYSVDGLQGIRSLDLEEVDSVVSWSRVRFGHAGMAALTGAGTAGVITGAEVLIARGSTADEGARNAPKMGAVAAAVGVDTVALLGLASRTVASTAQYYGYDPRRPEEQVFMMSVLSLGMAAGTPAKTAAYAELSQLTQLLFRNAGWDKLSEKVLTRLVQEFAAKFGFRLTKKKLGQVVPVAGILIGGGLNYSLVDRIAVAANVAYRERFLIERSDGELLDEEDDVIDAPARSDEGAISVIGLLEDADALPSPDPSHDSTTE